MLSYFDSEVPCLLTVLVIQISICYRIENISLSVYIFYFNKEVPRCWKDGACIKLDCCRKTFLWIWCYITKDNREKNRGGGCGILFCAKGRKPMTTRVHCTVAQQWTCPLMGDISPSLRGGWCLVLASIMFIVNDQKMRKYCYSLLFLFCVANLNLFSDRLTANLFKEEGLYWKPWMWPWHTADWSAYVGCRFRNADWKHGWF